MSNPSDSAGPSGTDFAPPPGPPPGRSEQPPAPSKPHDTQVPSTPESSGPNPAAPEPSPVASAPPPIHLGPTSNYSEPSPIDLEHPNKKFQALPTPSGLNQVQYSSDQGSSQAGTGPSQPLAPQPGVSTGHPATSAPEQEKYSNLPEVAEVATATITPTSTLASQSNKYSDLPEVATITPTPSNLNSQAGPPSGQPDTASQPSQVQAQASTPLAHIPPPPPNPPITTPKQEQASAPSGQVPPPAQSGTTSQPSQGQASITLANIPPPPPNPPSTTSKPGQTNTTSAQVPPPPQFPPPPGQPDATSKPTEASTSSAPQFPPPPPQFPPPPGQYETPTKPGFANLPAKFHIWTAWEKGEATEGHSVPCIELGPEPFGQPVYSTKMAESLSFRPGKWSDNGPTVGEVVGRGSFTTKSVLAYNGFQTDFGNTGASLVDIGSIGVWQFNIPVQGREEAWEWRRVKDPNSTGGLMSKLSKMAGLVGSLVLVPSGSPGDTTPFVTWTKGHGSKFKKESDLGVLEFHGPATTDKVGDAFQALAIMSVVKIQQDNRDETVAGMIKGSWSGSG